MYFAICDDQYIEIKVMEEYFREKNIEVDVYESGEALLSAYRKHGQRYDALFIDMEMGKMNGFATASAIRAIDDTALIAFVTSHTVYVEECFEFDPVWFLYKPVDTSFLERCVSKIQNILAKRQCSYTFIDSHQSVRLRCDDILYFEAEDHNLRIHLKDGVDYVIRKSLKSLEQELDATFCRIHASYMINMQYLIYMGRDTDLGQDVVVLKDCEKKLPVGRAFKKNANMAFIRFKQGEYGL